MLKLPIECADGRDIQDLKAEGFKAALAQGELSTGRSYEIKFSRSSAVDDGLHLVLAFPEGEELTAEEEGESLHALLHYARTLDLVKQYGATFGINFDQMRQRNSWHLHLVVPGTSKEMLLAPNPTQGWDGFSHAHRELQDDQYSDPVLRRGRLSSGQEFEISYSPDSAVKRGRHYQMSFQIGVVLTAAEEAESLSLFLRAVRELPADQRPEGYRLAINLGALQKENCWKAFVVAPNDEAERKLAPRLVDKWMEVAHGLMLRRVQHDLSSEPALPTEIETYEIHALLESQALTLIPGDEFVERDGPNVELCLRIRAQSEACSLSIFAHRKPAAPSTEYVPLLLNQLNLSLEDPQSGERFSPDKGLDLDALVSFSGLKPGATVKIGAGSQGTGH